jgi:pimeloyl-ACP methyl ester carboxylesterase
MTSSHRKTLGAALVILFLLAAGFVLRPAEPMVTEMGMNRTITSTDGTQVAFTTLGSGPALIIVDGAFCYRENGPASQLAPILAQHFTVFTYDRRGRGASGNASTYAIAREVEDLRALVQEAGGSALLVGISSGGALALQAVAAGVSVTGLALYEPPFIEENGRPRSYLSQRKRLNELVSAGDRAGAVRFFLTNIYDAPGAFVAVMPLVMRRTWTRNKSVAHTLEYDLALLEDWSILQERSAQVAVPTLVLGGDESPAPLKDAVATVADRLPNARRIYVQGQNHNFSAPAVAPLLIDFLRPVNGQHASTGTDTQPFSAKLKIVGRFGPGDTETARDSPSQELCKRCVLM